MSTPCEESLSKRTTTISGSSRYFFANTFGISNRHNEHTCRPTVHNSLGLLCLRKIRCQISVGRYRLLALSADSAIFGGYECWKPAHNVCRRQWEHIPVVKIARLVYLILDTPREAGRPSLGAGWYSDFQILPHVAPDVQMRLVRQRP
jgi:hypothetical protein